MKSIVGTVLLTRTHDVLQVVGLLLLLLGPQFFVDPQDGGLVEADGSLLFRVLVGTLYLVALCFLLSRPRAAMRLCGGQMWLLLLVGTALLSVAWSVAPAITLRRGIALVGTTIFAWYMAAHASATRFVRNLGVVLALVLLGSLLVIAFVPTVGLHQADAHTGAWRGLFLHKNALGRAVALATGLFLVLAVRCMGWQRLVWGLLTILALITVLPSRSATGLAILVVMLGVIMAAPLLRLRGIVVVPAWLSAGVVAIVFTAFVIGSIPTILRLLDRDPTLTGRTALWAVTAQMGLDRPVIGHGFSAFWRGDEGPSSEVYRRIGGWTPRTGHSSYLDIWVDLGAVGLVLTAGTLGVAVSRALRGVRRHEYSLGVAYLVILLFLIVVGGVESVFLRQNGFYWVTFATVALHLGTFRSGTVHGQR